MGKGWKNPLMAANAAKRGAKFTKLAREIQVAAKMGGPDPLMNARLRAAVADAKAESCPRDTIERAIRKGAGLDSEAAEIEEVLYEGYGPHQVGILVECQTDNRNRTSADIRAAFNKNGGHLAEMGAVAWMFERIAYIEGDFGKPVDDPEAEAIEAGANEVESQGDSTHSFIGPPDELKAIEAALTKRGWKITTAELSYKPKNPTPLDGAQKKEVIEFIQAIDDNDDTHRIHASVDLSAEH